MYKTFILCLNIMLSTQLLAAIEPMDFAYEADISINDNKPFYELTIPQHIYKNTLQNNLGDLRIFNAKQQIVPHAFNAHQPQNLFTKSKQFIPIFPIYTAKTNRLNDTHISIKNYGSIIDIKRNSSNDNQHNFLQGYILDLRHWNKPLDQLTVNFNNKQQQHWTHKVSIERSDDLNNWVSMVQNQPLINISYLGHRLQQNTINLSSSNSPYLRLIFSATDNEHRIDSIQISHQLKTSEKKTHWIKADVTASKIDGEYFFNNPLNTSINALDIRLPELNSLVKVNLFSRQSEQDSWIKIRSTTLYRLELDNTQIYRSLIKFPATLDTQWKLEVDQQGGGLGTPLTQLKMFYEDKKIVFLARGEAPYKAMWGSKKVQSVSQKNQQLVLSSLKTNEQKASKILAKAHINISAITSFNPQAIVDTPYEKPIDWQQILLWFILIAAALMLVYMALQLMKKISP